MGKSWSVELSTILLREVLTFLYSPETSVNYAAFDSLRSTHATQSIQNFYFFSHFSTNGVYDEKKFFGLNYFGRQIFTPERCRWKNETFFSIFM